MKTVVVALSLLLGTLTAGVAIATVITQQAAAACDVRSGCGR